MANRVRTERLEIKLTKEEKELFQAKMRQAKCKSMNHFLRKCQPPLLANTLSRLSPAAYAARLKEQNQRSKSLERVLQETGA